jgi:GDPmannose 4,6-dehydratase
MGDARKARQQLGWEPKVSFNDLVRLMVDHDMELARGEAAVREIQLLGSRAGQR